MVKTTILKDILRFIQRVRLKVLLNLLQRNNDVGVGGATSAKCIICTHWTLRSGWISSQTKQYLNNTTLPRTDFNNFDITMYLFREIHLDTMSHIRSVVVEKIANFQLSVSEADSRL